MFPYERDATIPEVDTFMVGVGVTHIEDEVRQSTTGLTAMRLRHYGLDLGRTTARRPGPRIATWDIPVDPDQAQRVRWTSNQQAWFADLGQELGAQWVLPASAPYHREYQLLDYIAVRVTAVGYPRASTAFAAFLYARHLKTAAHTSLATTTEEAAGQYGALANETRLTLSQRLEAADRGFPLGDLAAHLDAGVPFNLISDLLTHTPR